MGKTIIQQARGHGSFTYRVRRRAYIYEIGYPNLKIVGKAKIMKLVNSPAHTAPLARVMAESDGTKTFYIPAAQGLCEGQEIEVGTDKAQKWKYHSFEKYAE